MKPKSEYQGYQYDVICSTEGEDLSRLVPPRRAVLRVQNMNTEFGDIVVSYCSMCPSLQFCDFGVKISITGVKAKLLGG